MSRWCSPDDINIKWFVYDQIFASFGNLLRNFSMKLTTLNEHPVSIKHKLVLDQVIVVDGCPMSKFISVDEST